MLNPANGDPSHAVVNYVEEYLDLVESLPFDLQRSVSLMKEIDAKYQGKKKKQVLAMNQNCICQDIILNCISWCGRDALDTINTTVSTKHLRNYTENCGQAVIYNHTLQLHCMTVTTGSQPLPLA